MAELNLTKRSEDECRARQLERLRRNVQYRLRRSPGKAEERVVFTVNQTTSLAEEKPVLRRVKTPLFSPGYGRWMT